MDDRNQDYMDSDDSVFVLNNTDILDTSGQVRNRRGFNYRTQDKAGYSGYSERRCYQGNWNQKTQSTYFSQKSQFDQMFTLTLTIMTITLYMMYCTQRYW